MIAPHGGKIIDRLLTGKALEDALAAVPKMKTITIDAMALTDLKNIGHGRYSPLEGFIGKADLESVLKNSRLTSGPVWTVPILLDVSEDEAAGLTEGEDVCLKAEDGRPIAVLHLSEKYSYPKNEISKAVFGTDDIEHPGVKSTMDKKDVFLAGQIDLVDDSREPFPEYNLYPSETREIFEKRGWKTVAGFQTRNAPHLGHENMQKTVLALVDGVLIHPVIGKKKKGDYKDEVILKSYEALLDNYFPKDRVFMSILPMEMRYAGPREAVHHAIIRKNHGCTHLIVGRDHAGVGNYYEPEAAIEIFDKFDDLEIRPITLRGDFFHCKRCQRLESDRTCPHGEEHKIHFSGTVVRKMLVEGGTPPEEMIRPEVFNAQKKFDKPFIG
ncbi:sulfate adenylyltransferase [Candidatus Eisenbacteria bacterium]|uniref:Sulfate adenylyltransferase n=1 Tax=Eiseniibacteriota bacterium TaxID=2212470 RepID=A0ABV6YNN8_UNCEI